MTKNKRVEYILSYSKNKKVLHVGCADWPYTERRIHSNELLHLNLEEVSNELIGIDISREGISILKKNHNRIYHLDDDKEKYINESYDIIIATEVIEHVINQGIFLDFLRNVSSKETLLLITTPNAYSFKASLRSFFDKEYQHPDHLFLHSTKTVTQVLNRFGWTIVDFDYYSPPSKSITSYFMNSSIFILEKIFSNRIKDGMMLVAKRKTE